MDSTLFATEDTAQLVISSDTPQFAGYSEEREITVEETQSKAPDQ
jgi:hypothetical protein